MHTYFRPCQSEPDRRAGQRASEEAAPTGAFVCGHPYGDAQPACGKPARLMGAPGEPHRSRPREEAAPYRSFCLRPSLNGGRTACLYRRPPATGAARTMKHPFRHTDTLTDKEANIQADTFSRSILRRGPAMPPSCRSSHASCVQV